MKKRALITGITGQDGSYLAELLIEKNYFVYGLCRHVSYFNRNRIQHLRYNKNLKLIYGDLNDSSSIMNIIKVSKPDEIYNLAAQSHVFVSFNVPEYTTNVNALGLLRILDSLKNLKYFKTKVYQASTSEMFGNINVKSINENTVFNPVSPYGAAKVYSYYISEIYKKSYNFFIVNGILFNHESPRRGVNFVTKKIISSIVDILLDKQKFIVVGNLNAKRDWGYAKDYVYAMWQMLQQKKPNNYVIATNETHSVREFIEVAFWLCNIKVVWKGKGLQEVGVDQNNKIKIKVSKKYFRPLEIDALRGSYSKAYKKFKWKPKHKFRDVIKLMLIHELKSNKVDINKYKRLIKNN